VDALVGIVLGTGTPDKAQLEEVAVGAALGLQTEHSWATRSVQYGAPQSLGTKLAPDGTMLGLKLRLFADTSVGIELLPKPLHHFQHQDY
jgi:hypothetical protein